MYCSKTCFFLHNIALHCTEYWSTGDPRKICVFLFVVVVVVAAFSSSVFCSFGFFYIMLCSAYVYRYFGLTIAITVSNNRLNMEKMFLVNHVLLIYLNTQSGEQCTVAWTSSVSGTSTTNACWQLRYIPNWTMSGLADSFD